MQLGQQAGFAN